MNIPSVYRQMAATALKTFIVAMLAISMPALIAMLQSGQHVTLAMIYVLVLGPGLTAGLKAVWKYIEITWYTPEGTTIK